MELTIRRNTQGQRIRFLLMRPGEDGGAITGLGATSAGLQVAYLRDSDPQPTPLILVPWEEETAVPGAFRELDGQWMPGLYELVLPEAVCAAGAQRATVMITAPEARPVLIHINLVGYDPYDQDRLGLDCLSREARHDVISRAFREVLPEVVQAYLSRNLSGVQANNE